MSGFFRALWRKVNALPDDQSPGTCCTSEDTNSANVNSTHCKSNKLNIVSKNDLSLQEMWIEDEVELHRKICGILHLDIDCTDREITQMKHFHQLDTWDCGETILLYFYVAINNNF